MDKRITWIDTAKGVGIILVVLFHFPVMGLKGVEYWGGYLVLFYMIYFFSLSALFYKPGGLKKRIKSLMIPYISFYVLAFVLYALKSVFKNSPIDWLSFFNPFLGMTDHYENTPVWFLLSLTEISILTELLTMCCNKKRLLIISCILGIVGYILGHYYITNLYYIGSTLTAFPFFIVASTYRDFITKERNIWSYTICLFASFFTFMIEPYWCNLSQNSIPIDYVLFALIAFLSSFALMGMCRYIDKVKIVNVIFRYYGHNSLIVLCTHFFFIFIPYALQSRISNQWISTTCGLIIILIIEVPVIEFVNRKAKFLVGK